LVSEVWLRANHRRPTVNRARRCGFLRDRPAVAAVDAASTGDGDGDGDSTPRDFGYLGWDDDCDRVRRLAASDRAAEGAKLAEAAGLHATAKVAVVDTTVANAILTEAGSMGAQAVVCGSRGYTGVKSLMLGSVSHHVLQHADLPVVIVPSREMAAARAEQRRELETG
jgi:hypothetical protein